MQAWCCRRRLPSGALGAPVRHCCRCNDFHEEYLFEGRHRTCQAKYEEQRRDAARALAGRIAAAAGVRLPRPDPRPLAEGRQTEVIGGMDAQAQLRHMLGSALAGVLQELTGSPDDTPENREAAVWEIKKRADDAEASQARQVFANAPAAVARTPTHCVQCDRPTTTAGFGGRSTCLACFATGKYGLSLVDLNYAIDCKAIKGLGAFASRSWVAYYSSQKPD